MNLLQRFPAFLLAWLLMAVSVLANPDLRIVELEFEEGNYYGGDPVPFELVVWNIPPENPTDANIARSYRVDIHLTRDGFWDNADDHSLHIVTGGGLLPGDSTIHSWVQMMPGNLYGTFYVNARVTVLGSQSDRDFSDNTYLDVINARSAKITLLPRTFPETGIVSVTGTGGPGNSASDTPSISADGRYVTFASQASNLTGVAVDAEGNPVLVDNEPVGLINNNLMDIYVRDTQTNQVVLVTRAANGGLSNGASFNPQISADGRYVVYHSLASNLVAGDSNGLMDVFLWDRLTQQNRRVSIRSNGQQANGASYNAAISGNGRYVVFETEASNLVNGDTNAVADILVFDQTDASLRRINITDAGAQAWGGHSRNPKISEDGRHIVYRSLANNLAPNSASNRWDIYVHDRDFNNTGSFDQPGGFRTVRVSITHDENGNVILPNAPSDFPAISPDGRFVGFSTPATNLVNQPAQARITLSGAAATGSILIPDTMAAVGQVIVAPDVPATGEIAFTAQPGDGQTVTMGDGSGATVTFEFDSSVPPNWNVANTRVVVGATVTATRNNLIRAINNSVLTIDATPDVAGINPAIRVENPIQGPAGNVAITTTSPSLNVSGLAGAQWPNAPLNGDTVTILSGTGIPVEVSFYPNGGNDSFTDVPNHRLGVEIGRTADETRDNLFDTLLPFVTLDLPRLPTYLLPPILQNPQPGTVYQYSDDQGRAATFTFVTSPFTFNPAQPNQVAIGQTAAQTRGNLVRAVGALFAATNPFRDLDLLGYADVPAEGEIDLTGNPVLNSTIDIDDGTAVVRFTFADGPQPAAGQAPERFNRQANGNYQVFRTANLGELHARLRDAINDSDLRIGARIGASVLLGSANDVVILTHHQVGPIGNQAITSNEPNVQNPVIAVVGMAGGAIVRPGLGDTVSIFADEILHPAFTFQFGLPGTVALPNYLVTRGATGGETAGNLLAAIQLQDLPLVDLVAGPDQGQLQIVSRVGRGTSTGGVDLSVEVTSTAPDRVAGISGVGEYPLPRDGATITLNDGVNPAVTFEFDETGEVLPEHIAVQVGADAQRTVANLRSAITSANLNLIIEDAPGTVPGLLFTNEQRGTIGNNPIGTYGISPPILVTGMSGGRQNPVAGEAIVIDDRVNPARVFEFIEEGGVTQQTNAIAVVLGANDDGFATAENLIVAIKEAGLSVVAVDSSDEFTPEVLLTHIVPGPAGNWPITFVTGFNSLEVHGFAGGGYLGNGFDQVYVHDRDINANGQFDQPGLTRTELISVSVLGTVGNDRSVEPSLTRGGRFVSFRTFASNLQPLTVTRSDGEIFSNNWATNSPIQRIARFTDSGSYSAIYVRDREAGENVRVSVNRFGEDLRWIIGAPYTPSSRHGSLTPDGRFLIFASDAENTGGLAHALTNRNPLDVNSQRDIFLHDRRIFINVPEPDPNFPPTVTLTSPVPGTVLGVGSGIDLSAAANDLDGSITSLYFKVNGEVVGYAAIPALTYRWTPLMPGEYVITAVASDNRGRVVESAPVAFTVANDPSAPVDGINLTFSHPIPGSVYQIGSDIRIRVDASSLNGSISNIVYRVNGQTVGFGLENTSFPQAPVNPDTSYPYHIGWSPSNPGRYTISATATDTAGNSRIISQMVIISPANTGPDQPVITSPLPNAEIRVGDIVPVAVRATDPDGDDTIANVDVYVNGLRIGSSGTRPFSVNWQPHAPGTYVLHATSTDDRNFTSVNSATITVTVLPRAVPVIDFVAPLGTQANPPEFAINSPVHMVARASDLATPVQSVEFFVDGVLVGTGSSELVAGSSVFSASWTPTQPGLRQLVAVGVGEGGVRSELRTQWIRITPFNGSAPAVSIVYPSNGAALTNQSSTMLVANAASPNGDLQGVQFFVNGVARGAMIPRRTTPTPADFPYSLRWDLAQDGVGYHVVTATTRDANGNLTMSAPIVISTINSASPAPVARMNAPYRNARAVAAVDGGQVVSVTVVNPGSGYVRAPEVIFNGTGTGATGVALVADGVVTGINITNGGSGYTVPPTVTLRGGFPAIRLFEDGQRSAVATAIVDAEVDRIVVLDGGRGYREAPQVVVTGVANFVGRAEMTEGRVTQVEVINPGTRISAVVTVSFVGGFDLDPVFIGADVNAEAGAEVTEVQFFVNGRPVGAPGRAAPFATAWRPSDMGLVQLFAVASDDRGNRSVSDVIEFEIGPRTGYAPDVAIVSPETDATVSSRSLTLFTARASDADGEVVRVAFYANGVFVGNASRQHGGDLWTLTEKIPALASGEFSILAIATDDDGNVTHSSSRNVVIVPSNGPLAQVPTLNVSPNQLRRGQSTLLTVQPQATGAGIVSVAFYANGQRIGEDDESPFSLNWTPQTTGTFTIVAAALDTNGNTVYTQAREVSVETNDAPSLEWVRPSAGSQQTVGQPVFVEVRAWDNEGEVSLVEIVLDGNVLGEAERIGLTDRYALTWTPTQARTYQLRARAVDNAGLSRLSEARTVDVRLVQGAAPTVSIVQPDDDVTVTTRSQVLFTAQAADSDGSVSSVEFFVDGAVLGTAARQNGTEFWSLTTDFQALGAGTYEVVAMARDNVNNVAISAPVEVTVIASSGPVAQAPTLSVSPSVLRRGQSTLLSVQPSSTGAGIVSVDFYANGRLIGEDDEAPFSLNWTPASSGAFAVVAVATDTNGNLVQSTPRTVSVEGNQAPVASWIRPSATDRFAIGQPVELIVQASDADGFITLVEYIVNGEVLDEAARIGLTNRYSLTWLPESQQRFEVQARVVDNAGLATLSDVRVVDTRVGSVGDAGNVTGFVAQMHLDLLGRVPSRQEFDFLTRELEAGRMTRGQVVKSLMDHRDFNVVRWVISTYFTILGEPPSVVRLEEGIALLETEGAQPTLTATPPLLPLLVDSILTSSEFRQKYNRFGTDMEPELLFDTVWQRSMGRSHPGPSRRTQEISALTNIPELYSLHLATYVDPVGNAVVDEHTALILLLLERDIQPNELQALLNTSGRNTVAAAQWIVTRSEFVLRFANPRDFFGRTRGDNGEGAKWLGSFNDFHFDYGRGLGWIKHAEHEWLYCGGEGYHGGIWMWDDTQKDWLWTRHDIYPMLYSHKESTWVYYKKNGTPARREFRFYRDGSWGPWQAVSR